MVRRALLGNPVSSAIEAKPGHKMEAYGKAYGHLASTTLQHMGKPTAVGAALGGAAGAAHGAATGGGGLKARLARTAMHGGVGALAGATGGATVGSIHGGIKGNYGAEASRIHGEHSKHKAD